MNNNKTYTDQNIITEEISQTVLEISKINFSIPETLPNWASNIYQLNGKNKYNILAAVVLSQIIESYQAYPVYDEATLNIVQYKKRFNHDKLFINFDTLKNLLGYSKQSLIQAIEILKKLNLITTETRDLKSENKRIQKNCLFVEPVPENIRKITFNLSNNFSNSLSN